MVNLHGYKESNWIKPLMDSLMMTLPHGLMRVRFPLSPSFHPLTMPLDALQEAQRFRQQRRNMQRDLQ